MSDPFSVAGTAVGITSLGLQVCQALVTYYASYRSFDQDIDITLKRVEGLQTTLEALNTIVVPAEAPSHNAAKQLRKALESLETGLKELERMAKKCAATTLPANLGDKGKNVIKRVWWPFRKETLEDIQRAVDRLQGNLQLALQVFGVDSANRQVEAVSAATMALTLQNGRIESHMEQHNHRLDCIGREIERASNTHMGHQASMESHLSNLSQQSTRVSLKLLDMERHLATIASHVQMPQSSVVTTRQVTAPLAACRTLQSTLENELYTYKHSSKRSRLKLQNDHRICSCQFFSRSSATRKHWKWFSTASQYFSQHRPDCVHFPHTDYTRSLEARFVFCTKALGFCTEIGFNIARQAGCMTIYPSLRFRAVVPSSSPAFAPFFNAREKIDEWERNSISPKQVALLLEDVSSAVVASFRQGLAGPFDCLPSGTTIFDQAATVIYLLYYERGFFSFRMILHFVESLLAEGVPLTRNTVSDFDSMEFIQLLALTPHGPIDSMDLYSRLVRRAGTWSLNNLESRPQQTFDKVYQLLLMEEVYDVFEDGHPLLDAVLRRSSQEAAHILDVIESDEFYASHEYIKALTYAFAWPEGLELILSRAEHARKALEHKADKLFSDALILGNELSIIKLIEHNIDISEQSWDEYLLLKDRFPEKTRQLIGHYVALRLFEKHSRPSEGFEKPLHMLYQAKYLDSMSAELLWEAGIRDIDTTTCDPSLKCVGTPLWLHSQYPEMLYIEQIEEYLSPLRWFIDKCARLDWSHPSYHNSPAHNIARNITKFIWYHGAQQSSIWRQCIVREITLMLHTDGCICYCSDEGCIPMTCAIQTRNCARKSSSSELRWWSPNTSSCDSISTMSTKSHEYEERRERLIVKPLLSMVDSHDEPLRMARAVIRVLTFDALGMTHTCCARIFEEICGDYSRPDKKERNNIWYSESEDIDLFQSLMEDFITKLEDYDGRLQTFYDTIWKPKMDDICNSTSGFHETRERVRDIGVVLEEVCSDIDSEED